MLTLQGVSKFLGKKELFRDVSFHVHPGERIGLIGPNGTGKTTLFHILMGETEPDSGTVIKSKNLRLGYLPQQWIPGEIATVLAHVMNVHEELGEIQNELQFIQQELNMQKDPKQTEAFALRQTSLLERLEHLGGYDLESRARKILAGLGFREDQLDRPVSTLSGGWVMRTALARLLLAEPDLLLLDEPTNHLDLDSLLWLEEYLLNTPSAMILISHDRAFLNRIVQRIVELEQGVCQEYVGNYDTYLEDKSKRREIHFASYKNQQERIRQVERFVERNRYRKDRARQVQSRLKHLEKIDRIESPPEESSSIHFSFPEPPRSGRRVIELRSVHKSYGDHVVYKGIDCVIERGDRIAFLGPNGAGKSTLLKILAGVIDIDEGERVLGHQTFVGYYAQHQWEQLNPAWTVLEEVFSISGDMSQTQLRGLLGAFLFRGEDVLKRVSVLSGGEKARLTLCKLLLQRPNILLLDEPTNHLDIPSCDVLEKALNDFSGTICFISHDRHFINAVSNKILVVGPEQLHIFPGNYEDFQNIWKDRIEGREEEPEKKESKQGKVSAGSSGPKGQERKRLEAEWRNELYRLKQPLQKQMESVEAALDEVQKRQETLNVLLADPDTYQDGSRVQELQKEYQQCRKEIGTLTKKWEETALALEELEENFRRDKEKQWGKSEEDEIRNAYTA